MAKQLFTVVCDFVGGTYVSQLEGGDPVDIARKWASTLRSEKFIPKSSVYIANSLIRDLDSGYLPTPLDGLANVWQSGAWVGRGFYTATFVQSS
jgi:hypothetical protein